MIFCAVTSPSGISVYPKSTCKLKMSPCPLTSLLKGIKFVFSQRKIRLLIVGTAYQQKCRIAGESFDGLAKKKKQWRKEGIQNKERLKE